MTTVTPTRGAMLPVNRPVLLFRAFLRRDFEIALSYRLPFAVDLFQSVLSMAFLYFLARVVGHKVVAEANLRVGYFGFAVIGTIMVGILTVSLASFSKRIRTDQMTGTLEVLFSMPTPPWLAVLESASYQVIYAIITSILSFLLAFWFGLRFHMTLATGMVALADFVGVLVIFSALGMGLAAFVMVFKRGETLTTLLIGGLSLIGGVLYPVSLLSAPLRHLADILPFTWALEVMRAALLGATSDLHLLLAVWVVAVVITPISVWVFNVSLAHAKRKGAVGQY
jgi:ABC-type multidrug transport system permease subunit